MLVLIGNIECRLLGEGSKSEGLYTILVGQESEYILYRKGLLPFNDPFFEPYDRACVRVEGEQDPISGYVEVQTIAYFENTNG